MRSISLGSCCGAAACCGLWTVLAACGSAEVGVTAENTADRCENDLDDDGDGRIDCEDRECRDFVFCVDRGEGEGEGEGGTGEGESEQGPADLADALCARVCFCSADANQECRRRCRDEIDLIAGAPHPGCVTCAKEASCETVAEDCRTRCGVLAGLFEPEQEPPPPPCSGQPDACCSQDNPCGLDFDFSCQCVECPWDDWDCGGGFEAEAEAEGEGDCCEAWDPCFWGDDGFCDCGFTCDWFSGLCTSGAEDFDCAGEGEAEAEGEAESEGESLCCAALDPCAWGNDGICDCPFSCAWSSGLCTSGVEELDCEGEGEAEAEAEAESEAEAEPVCGDPLCDALFGFCSVAIDCDRCACIERCLETPDFCACFRSDACAGGESEAEAEAEAEGEAEDASP